MTPEVTKVIAIAREWRTAASADFGIGATAINRFLKLWIAFNALYAVRFDRVRGDRNQVRRFARWAPVVAAHERGLGERVYRRSVESIGEFGVYNFERAQRIHVSQPYSSSDMFEAVYQIRCNLFHGRKTPRNLRDAQLVQAGASILTLILDALLQNAAIWDEAAA